MWTEIQNLSVDISWMIEVLLFLLCCQIVEFFLQIFLQPETPPGHNSEWPLEMFQ